MSSPGDSWLSRPAPSSAILAWLTGAWLITAALIARALYPHHRVALPVIEGTYSLYFLVQAARVFRRSPRTLGAALPLLIFAAPFVRLLDALTQGRAGASAPGLGDLLPILAAVLIGHVLLHRLSRNPDRRNGGISRGALVTLIATLWVFSTIDQVYRFQLYLNAGDPEDTAFVWDCFRNWAAGGAPASGWSAAWGHRNLTHYFGIHFSPILIASFAVARLVPHLATLFVIQNLFVGAGLVLWARTLSRPLSQTRTDPRGHASSFLWILALLAASPPLSAMLRAEIHPLLWALPVLAFLHDAYDRRRRLPFLLAGLALFAFREDLGLVWAAYAALAWLERRRDAGGVYWFLAPWIGLAGFLLLQGAVQPRFTTHDAAFFREVFQTSAVGLFPFLISIAARPGELLLRLFRPGNLVLVPRMAATGLGVPARSWRWIPGVPLAVVFSLVGRDLQLLRLDAHFQYIAIPGLYLVVASLGVVWPSIERSSATRRDTLGVLLLTLALVQTAGVSVPGREALLHPARYREEVMTDLRRLPPGERAWIPLPLLLAAPDPARAVPLHNLAVKTLDREGGGAPALALIPSTERETPQMLRHLARRYPSIRLSEQGTHYDVYDLRAR